LTPPPILLLQFLNASIGFSQFLMMSLAISEWKSAGWSAAQIGGAMTLVNLCYGGLVGLGGRRAEEGGRAKGAIWGASLGLLGGLSIAFFPGARQAFFGTCVCFAGSAFFFPACAGLFSDSASPAGVGDADGAEPLHRKVAGYNLGWSAGNLAGFTVFGFLADRPLGLAALLPALGYGVAGLALWPWRRLPCLPPKAEGDRAGHPALAGLTFMGRANLFLVSILTMGQLCLLEKALGGLAEPRQARHLASLGMALYSAGYVSMFLLLGRWKGWILRPRVLWACQAGLLLGPLALVLFGRSSFLLPFLLPATGLLIGWGYGAAYTASIYYSLRLPHGASRAAGLHETWLGIGNALGPVLAGGFLSLWQGYSSQALAGLGSFLLVFGVTAMVFQYWRIPAIEARKD
jgi:MFS family permease